MRAIYNPATPQTSLAARRSHGQPRLSAGCCPLAVPVLRTACTDGVDNIVLQAWRPAAWRVVCASHAACLDDLQLQLHLLAVRCRQVQGHLGHTGGGGIVRGRVEVGEWVVLEQSR
jgi:hypothetical protein